MPKKHNRVPLRSLARLAAARSGKMIWHRGCQMSSGFDYVIKGGTIVDGLGGSPKSGDVAVAGGLIAEVGGSIDAGGAEVIDADGAIVTPGWIDLHTHYDGQVSWDDAMEPSSANGVTTIVMGNCGVGFAPVRPGQEQALIELMEGVEDIPGTALYEGMPWGNWETFGEYLNYLDSREYTLDIGAQIPHGAVRFYVMGERGRLNEDATADDLAAMSDVVAQGLSDGALGFSTSRIRAHRALWGEPVPGTFAADEELFAIADAMKSVDRGVFQIIPGEALGTLESMEPDIGSQIEEHARMVEVSKRSGRPVTFTLIPTSETDTKLPQDLWRTILERTAAANADGAQLFPQVSARPIGFLTGLSGYHAFIRRPSYMAIAHLPLAERAREMAKAEVRAAILAETDVPVDEPGSMKNVFGVFQRAAPALYPLANPVDYEPEMDSMFAMAAAAAGQDPLEYSYDFLIGEGGSRFAALMAVDVHSRMEILGEMLRHPDTVTGLSDAGAHVTLICDGSMPTSQLSHWTRDRHRGDQLPLEFLVAKQTSANARLHGLTDRGSLEVGKRADVNVIDHENLSVGPPEPHHDLPAGGTRLMQPVTGYVATMVKGTMTRRFDADTGNRPGGVVRSG